MCMKNIYEVLDILCRCSLFLNSSLLYKIVMKINFNNRLWHCATDSTKGHRNFVDAAK